jgi:hypothetical protein
MPKGSYPKSIEHRQKVSLKLKGRIPWNKGKKYELNQYPAHRKLLGENHLLYKGEEASYVAKHEWVRQRLGKPQKCEHCGTTEKRMYHWANLSGEYRRELSDWVRLCVSCHHLMDNGKLELFKNEKLSAVYS